MPFMVHKHKLNYIQDTVVHWNVDPELFWITDSFPIKYYGLFWILGLILAYFIIQRMYKFEGKPIADCEKLTTYIFVGIILGGSPGSLPFL